MITQGSPIQIPDRVNDVIPASELTAVIGDDLWQASEEEAWAAIEGFTVSNDVTATGDWPGWSDPDHGMITGVGYKLFPTFSPILTRVEPKRPEVSYSDLGIQVRVDGELAVDGSMAQLGFSIPEMISFASNIIELHRSDVVALGDPKRTLDDASSVTYWIEDVGELTNPIERL